MILQAGDKVLVAHRRLFENDHGRYFVGEVEAFDFGIAKVRGWSWMRDSYQGAPVRKADLRTKLLSLSSGTLILYVLPRSTVLESLRLASEGGELVLTDGEQFVMNLAEDLRRSGAGAPALSRR